MSEMPAKPPERLEILPQLRRLHDAGLLKPKSRVLFYGCGLTEGMHWLKKNNFSVHGYDPWPKFGYPELPEGKFDYVLVAYPLERDKTVEARLLRAYDYLRPGGNMVLVVRNWGPWAAKAEGSTPEDAAQALCDLLSSHVQAPLAPRLPIPDPEDPALCVMLRRPGNYLAKLPYEWVNTPEALARMLETLRKIPRIALDVETTLEEPRIICTIQIGMAGKTYIVDALAFNELEAFRDILESPAIEKIIHNASFEEQMFAKHGIRIRNIYDTLPASRKKHRSKKTEGGHKLGEVCERELGVFLDKSLQTSDWTQRPLTEEQLNYAAVDAEVLLELYDIFNPPPPPQTMDLF